MVPQPPRATKLSLPTIDLSAVSHSDPAPTTALGPVPKHVTATGVAIHVSVEKQPPEGIRAALAIEMLMVEERTLAVLKLLHQRLTVADKEVEEAIVK